jgi:hypothetical protein
MDSPHGSQSYILCYAQIVQCCAPLASHQIFQDEDPAIRLLEWLECETRCPRQTATQGETPI